MRRLACLALAGWISGFPPPATAHAEVGTPVDDMELALLEGGKARLLGAVPANVLVFFRPDHERSLATLKRLAECQKGLARKPVRWVAIVSSTAPRDRVRAAVREAGVAMPVLIDEGDALYARLGVVLHPVVAVVGADRRLAAFEPFRAVNYCAIVTARIRHALGELSDQDLQRELSPPEAREGGDAEVARRYRALAEALFKAKSYDKALEYVRKSLAKDPRLAGAHRLLGAILAAQGDCRGAAEAFRRAREIDPGDALTEEGLTRCGS